MRRAWFFTGHTTTAAAAAASRHRQQPLSRSLPAQVPFGLPTVWVYILIANVVLVNMLIAMFSETYQRIKKNAEVEYHYQRFLNIFEYNHVVNAVPPPLSLPLLLADALGEALRSCSRRCSRARSRYDDDDDDSVGALQRLAAQMPGVASGGGHSSMPLSKQYVQRFLKADSEGESEKLTSLTLARRVEGLVSAMEERVTHQLEHIDDALHVGGGGPGAAGGEANLGHEIHRLAQAMERIESVRADKARADKGHSHSLFSRSGWSVGRRGHAAEHRDAGRGAEGGAAGRESAAAPTVGISQKL